MKSYATKRLLYLDFGQSNLAVPGIEEFLEN